MIFCAWRLGGPLGAIVGGACFILPGLAVILALAAVFLAASPPAWISGAADGAGATVPAIALAAAIGLSPASWRRAGTSPPGRVRWLAYLAAGGLMGALAGQFLVLVLAASGLAELLIRTRSPDSGRYGAVPLAVAAPAITGGLAALAWVAFKIGALSYGGGFVIVPLMQHDAVVTYHWMTGQQFLSAVALGQVTPGPVVQTVAVVGYAAAGVPGGLLAALVAFAPSFAFVIAGAPRFARHGRRMPRRDRGPGGRPAAVSAQPAPSRT